MANFHDFVIDCSKSENANLVKDFKVKAGKEDIGELIVWFGGKGYDDITYAECKKIIENVGNLDNFKENVEGGTY